MLVRQIKKDGRLPPEKISTVSFILFIPAILIFALVAKSISSWRSDIQADQEQLELSQFVRSVYDPLDRSQVSLLKSFSEMRELLKTTKSMEQDYPNHAQMIAQITQQWREGQTVLYNVYNQTDKEVRRAWISFNTMDQQDVLAKFSKQAVRLESEIKKAEKKYQRHIHSVQDELIHDIDSARRLLNANRNPPKSKKQKEKNRLTEEKIVPFSDRTTANLINFVGSIDPRLKNEIEDLQQLINITGQQSEVISSHLIKNQDLEKPLTRIINNWKNLENNSKQKLNQILFAIEAEYIALSLGLSEKNPAIKAIHKSLFLNVPYIVGKAIKQRNIINQSYNIKPTE